MSKLDAACVAMICVITSECHPSRSTLAVQDGFEKSRISIRAEIVIFLGIMERVAGGAIPTSPMHLRNALMK